MTVERINAAVCAAWSYVDERDETCWKVIVRTDKGEWLEIDDGGVAYDQTAASLRKFISDWITDATAHEPESMPSPDTVEIYEQAAQFIEANS